MLSTNFHVIMKYEMKMTTDIDNDEMKWVFIY